LEKFFETLYSILDVSSNKCQANILSFSGGLDSSILAYHLKERKIDLITIIMDEFLATDLTYCQLAAKHFHLNLDLKAISTTNLLNAIEETIKILKNFNVIEIRNLSVMYLVLMTIKKSGSTRIITGDGADELFAGYNFFLKKTEKEIEDQLKRIWKIMHFPTIKIAESLGIKVECPFLDEQMVQFAQQLPIKYKVNKEGEKIFGKWILRKAYERNLPKAIVWRQKSPIQDGSGTTALTNLFDSIIVDKVFTKKCNEIKKTDGVILQTKESLQYYEIYRKYFEPPKNIQKISYSKKCKFCRNEIQEDSNFCRMCGSYPV